MLCRNFLIKVRQSIHFSDATDQAIDYCLQDLFPTIVYILLSLGEEDTHAVRICTRIFASHAFNGNIHIATL
jgi:hypothetical protein